MGEKRKSAQEEEWEEISKQFDFSKFLFPKAAKAIPGDVRGHIRLSSESTSTKLYGCKTTQDSLRVLECIHELVGSFYIHNSFASFGSIILDTQIHGIRCVMRLMAEMLDEIIEALDVHDKEETRG